MEIFDLKDRKIIKKKLTINLLKNTLPSGSDEAWSKVIYGTLSKRARKKIEELVGMKPLANDIVTFVWNENYGISIVIRNSGADNWYCGADIKDRFLDLIQLKIERRIT